jgi:hypothetical protein
MSDPNVRLIKKVWMILELDLIKNHMTSEQEQGIDEIA